MFPYRSLLFLITPFLFALQSQSASPPLFWHWANPAPHGNNAVDMIQKNGVFIQVTERGRLYSSTNLGAWIPHPTHTQVALRGIAYLGDRLLVSAAHGHILWADALDNIQLIELDTEDWLEDIAASSTVAVAVGDNGSIYSSSNGVDWTQADSGTTEWLRSVTHGNNLFVVVGENGLISTSPNGSDWTPQDSGVTKHLNHVHWSGQQFHVAGNEGTALDSANGTDWQNSSLSTTNDLLVVASINGTNRIYAGESEVRLVLGSEVVNQMDSALANPAPRWTYLSGLSVSNRYFLAGRTGFMTESVTTNGTDHAWFSVHNSNRDWIWDLVSTPSYVLAVGDRATVMTSQYGFDFEQEFVPQALANSIFLGAGHGAGLSLIVGNAGSAIASINGINWFPVTPRPTTNDLQGIAFRGNRVYVSGGNGSIYSAPANLSSVTNATQWTSHPTPTAKFLSGLVSHPGGLVVSGNDGTLLTSANGTDWVSRDTQTTNWLYRVRYLNNQLVVVGQNGTLLTSEDGTTWTPRDTGTTRWLNQVEYFNNTYYIVGVRGTLLSSSNLTEFQPDPFHSPKSIYGAAVHENQLLVSGLEGTILRGTSHPIQLLDFTSSPNTSSVTNLFIFSGIPGHTLNIESSTNLSTWEDASSRQFPDASGILIERLERPLQPQEFYKGRLDP